METITTFDPDLGSEIMQARFNHIKVIDPAAFPPNLSRNHVIDPLKSFNIEVEWELTGFLAPMWQAAAGANDWLIRVYAESMGAGQEKQIASADVAISGNIYKHVLTASPGVLQEGDPGPASPSGVYKLVVTAFLNTAIAGQPYDITGFAEGPMIRVENPL